MQDGMRSRKQGTQRRHGRDADGKTRRHSARQEKTHDQQGKWINGDWENKTGKITAGEGGRASWVEIRGTASTCRRTAARRQGGRWEVRSSKLSKEAGAA